MACREKISLATRSKCSGWFANASELWKMFMIYAMQDYWRITSQYITLFLRHSYKVLNTNTKLKNSSGRQPWYSLEMLKVPWPPFHCCERNYRTPIDLRSAIVVCSGQSTAVLSRHADKYCDVIVADCPHNISGTKLRCPIVTTI